MTPENQKIADHLKKVGTRMVEMEGLLLSVAETQAQQYKLIAARVSDFTPEEDAILRTAAQRCLNGCKQILLLHKQFAKDVEDFSQR